MASFRLDRLVALHELFPNNQRWGQYCIDKIMSLIGESKQNKQEYSRHYTGSISSYSERVVKRMKKVLSQAQIQRILDVEARGCHSKDQKNLEALQMALSKAEKRKPVTARERNKQFVSCRRQSSWDDVRSIRFNTEARALLELTKHTPKS